MWVTLIGRPRLIETTGILVLQLRSWKENLNNFRKAKGLALQCPVSLLVKIQLQILLFRQRVKSSPGRFNPGEGAAETY
jgi:hypothetical protein